MSYHFLFLNLPLWFYVYKREYWVVYKSHNYREESYIVSEELVSHITISLSCLVIFFFFYNNSKLHVTSQMKITTNLMALCEWLRLKKVWELWKLNGTNAHHTFLPLPRAHHQSLQNGFSFGVSFAPWKKTWVLILTDTT
jgi:hypothetical protein